MFRHVYGASSWAVKVWVLDILWDWHEDLHVVGDASFLIVAFDLDEESDFGGGWLLGDNIHREQWLNSDIKPVAHKFELSIWRDKSDKPFILKLTESDTLMKLNIIELNSLTLGSPTLSLIIGLIIESQFQIRHTGKLTISINNPDNLRLNNIIGGPNQHIKLFDHIQKELILIVFDTFRAPRDHTRYLCGNI